jgi:hypothetical protein
VRRRTRLAVALVQLARPGQRHLAPLVWRIAQPRACSASPPRGGEAAGEPQGTRAPPGQPRSPAALLESAWGSPNGCARCQIVGRRWAAPPRPRATAPSRGARLTAASQQRSRSRRRPPRPPACCAHPQAQGTSRIADRPVRPPPTFGRAMSACCQCLAGRPLFAVAAGHPNFRKFVPAAPLARPLLDRSHRVWAPTVRAVHVAQGDWHAVQRQERCAQPHRVRHHARRARHARCAPARRLLRRGLRKGGRSPRLRSVPEYPLTCAQLASVVPRPPAVPTRPCLAAPRQVSGCVALCVRGWWCPARFHLPVHVVGTSMERHLCAACRRPLSPGAQRGSGSTGPPRQYSPRSAFICSGPARGSASCPSSTRSNLSAAGHPRLGRLRAAVVCPPAAAAGGGLAAARVRLHSSSPAPPGHQGMPPATASTLRHYALGRNAW